MGLFTTPYGEFQLQRYPSRSREILQAFCSADALLLGALAECQEMTGTERLLTVNDEHGALSIPPMTAGFDVALWSDSALSQLAVQHNARSCGVNEPAVYWSTVTPPAAQQVLMRVPKNLAYFEYQLAVLSRLLAPGSRVDIAGMDKHLSPQTGDIIEHYLGATTRHRGQRKARRFTTMIAENLPRLSVTPQSRSYAIDSPALTLEALPNVFSGERLDGGSRLLLSALPTMTPAQEAVDLACGNGVLGLVALATGLAQSLSFCDESAMAIESARRNSSTLVKESLAGKLDIRFHHGDGLLDLPARPDLILCNPPFHLHHVVDEFAGQRLLHQCARALVSGGQLLLVANRHLKYAPLLRRHFPRVEQVTQDERFVVWQAFAG